MSSYEQNVNLFRSFPIYREAEPLLYCPLPIMSCNNQKREGMS
jgi:hypothetical protein